MKQRHRGREIYEVTIYNEAGRKVRTSKHFSKYAAKYAAGNIKPHHTAEVKSLHTSSEVSST